MSAEQDLPPAVAEVVRLWLAGVESPHSRRAYRADVLAFFRFADVATLHAATLAQVVDWRDHLQAAGQQRATVARRLDALKSLAQFAVDYGALEHNFARLCKSPKRIRRGAERLLSVDYLAMLLHAAATERDRVLLRLLYYSLARNAEVANLRWGALRCDDRGHGAVAIVGKGLEVRTVVIPTWVYAQLVRFRGAAPDSAPMFPGQHGKPISSNGLYRMVARTAKRARIPGNVSPHWLRHAGVSQALDGGCNIAVVQQTAGHASMATTGEYAHANPRDGAGLYLPII